MLSAATALRLARIFAAAEMEIIRAYEDMARAMTQAAPALVDFPVVQRLRETESRASTDRWTEGLEGRAAAATQRMRAAYTARPAHGGKTDYG